MMKKLELRCTYLYGTICQFNISLGSMYLCCKSQESEWNSSIRYV